jgi:multidrug resistance efflux pump
MTDKEETAKDNKTEKPAKDPVRRWTFIIMALTLALLVWYLRSDRVTPYSSQARVHALVVPIASEVSGIISSVNVANNQVVKSGQELFQIETDNYELAVKNAEANVENARKGAGASESSVEAARASVISAQANMQRAKQDAIRMRNIREQDPGAISQRRLESAEAGLATSEGQVASAEANLEKAIRSLGAQGDENSAVQQALAALEQAELNLQKSTIRAPDDGVVTGVRLDKGTFAAAGAAQLTFIPSHKVWVQADFTENNLGHLDAGDEVALVFDVLPGEVINGRVTEVGFGVQVDSSPLGSLPTISNNNEWLRSAQRYPVLIEFDLPEDSGKTRIKVGSQVSVVVFTGDNVIFNPISRLYIKLVSILTYAY